MVIKITDIPKFVFLADGAVKNIPYVWIWIWIYLYSM